MSGRRRFLQVLGASAAAACSGSNDGTSSGGGPPKGSSGPTLPAGYLTMKFMTLSNVQANAGFYGVDIITGHDMMGGVTTAPVFLGLDAGGLYAMTATCAHLQCDLTFNSVKLPKDCTATSCTGIQCICHGSQYDLNGTVMHGPAPKSLVHYPLAIDDAGQIGVDITTTVDPSVRVAV